MQKNRKIKYYLLNGKNGEGNTLDLLDDGRLKRDYDDIATLDLKTIDIPYKDVTAILGQYNPNVDLSGKYYDAQYPYKKVETKAFAPVFKVEDEKCKYYLDHLKYFAEQRDRKVKRGESVQLDKNTILENYIQTLLYNILRYNHRSVVKQDSIVAKNIKDEIEAGYRELSMKSAEKIIKNNYKLQSMLDHYTQIRNLTLEYMASISDISIPSRRDLNNFEKYENYGLEPRESGVLTTDKKSDKQIKYYQMTLTDFTNLKK